MSEQQSEGLAHALDRIDRLRSRCLWVTRVLIYPSVIFFTVGILILLFSSNKWLGVVFATISLYGLIGALGTNISQTLYANTRLLLRAIEGLRGHDQGNGGTQP